MTARRAPAATAPVVATTTPFDQRHFIARPIEPGLTFGVLRRSFKTHVNDATSFGWTKLHPIRPARYSEEAPKRTWQPTAFRHEVLLPSGASDLMSDPRRLFETFEDQAVAHQTDLAVLLKLTFDPGAPLHVGWERARGLARAVFVAEHNLPVLLVSHVPSLSGTRTPAAPHVHVIALARVLGVRGFGGFCTVARDEAHAPLAAAWRASAARPASALVPASAA